MRQSRSCLTGRLVLAGTLLLPVFARAQTYEVIHRFAGEDRGPHGKLIQSADGTLFGTTLAGGCIGAGNIFALRPDGLGGLEFSTVHEFSGPDGDFLYAELFQASDGNFYGTTYLGGQADLGTVFRMNPSGAVVTLHSFTGSDGANPSGGLIQGTDGAIYGTTRRGGTGASGTIFRMDLSGNLNTLHSFSVADGATPYAGLIQARDGNLYGTTYEGGSTGYGTVFKMSLSGNFVSLHSFAGVGDGAGPTASLIQATDGILYGTTSFGTIFILDASGNLTNLHTLSTAEGAGVYGSLIQGSDGNFYGTAFGGADGASGTAFRMDAAGVITVLHVFANEGHPYAGLVEAADGNFYGGTSQGGPNGTGIVFRMDASGVLTFLYPLPQGDGSQPAAALILADDGNFYGTTSNGGSRYDGTVFRMDASGCLTTLHEFTGGDGASPVARLVQAPDGNLYGTTRLGGAYDKGTVFRMDLSGNLTTLHSFTGDDGRYPASRLLAASDGNLYGTTNYGSPGDKGTIFRLDSSANFMVFHSFFNNDGEVPQTDLIEPGDGYMYGTTSIGGPWANGGTVFRIDFAGNLSTLHNFTGPDGSHPQGILVKASNGNFYGTTYWGGANGFGAAFRMDPLGHVTALHSFNRFNSTDGANPYAGLVEAADGNFYGTTQFYGAASGGTLFRMDSSCNVTILHSFVNFDGAWPQAALIPGDDGRLYGATLGGGLGFGVIFRLALGPSTSISLSSAPNPSAPNQPVTFHAVVISAAGTPTGTVTFKEELNGQILGTASLNDGNAEFTTSSLPLGNHPITAEYAGEGGFSGSVSSVLTQRVTQCDSPTAAVSGSASVCAGGSATIQAALTGQAPWSVTWSDGVTQTGVSSSPASRSVSPSATTTYAVTAISDAKCQGTSSGSATVTVNPPPVAAASGTATICSGSSASLTGSGGVSCSWAPTTGLSSATSCTPTASPAATTTYTLTVTDGNGCVSTNNAAVTVTVKARPTAAVNGSASVCAGSSATILAALTGTAPWTVTWSDGVTQSGIGASPATRSVSPASTTTYTLTAVSDANCSGTSSGSATVTVRPLPTAVASGSATIGAGSSTPLTGSGGVSCSWSPATGLSSATSCTPAASPSVTTTYTLTVTDASGCSSTNAATVTVTVGSAKPDLVVTVLTVPSAAVAGSAISVADTAKNQGSGFAAISTTRFYLSVNATWEAGDTLIGSRAVPNLAPGTTNAASTTLTIPSNTTTGNYYVIARADADGVAAESNESNNTRSAAIRVSPPDLIVSAFSAPAASGAGLTITVTDTTKNQTGTGPAGATTTRFFLSTDAIVGAGDPALGGRAVPALASGATSSGTTSVTIPAGTAAGSYFILAKADGDNALSETDENNNLASSAILIGPDLVVSALTVPATGTVGSAISVTDTTRNQGGGSAAASTTRFYLSMDAAYGAGDVLLTGSRAVPSLNAGISSSGPTSVTIPGATAAGSYYIIAVADADGVVPEAMESNNTRSSPIVIRPDLVVSALTVPATGGANLPITIADTTRNQGGAGAPASTTKFYLSTNSTLGTGDVLLGSRSILSLAVGASNSGSTTVTIPAGTAAGTYSILAVADGDNLIVETDETNNLKAAVIKISPDLIVSVLTAPSTAAAGGSVTVSDTTKNQGQGSAIATKTKFFLSANTTWDGTDPFLGERSVISLASGQTSAGTTPVTIPAGTAPGSYYILAVADANAEVSESSETNNIKTLPITVTGP